MAIPVIDPDLLAYRLGLSGVGAGRLALKKVDAAIDAGESVIVETTLSGRSYHRRICRARAAGFRTELHYIGVDFPEISMARVALRVAQGGHDVPQEDIRRRFARSLQNLPAMIMACDSAILYDNVQNGEIAGYVELVRFSSGNPELLKEERLLPEWVHAVLRRMRAGK